MQLAKQKILRFCASLVHCYAVKKNVIVASQLYDVAGVLYSYSSQ